MAITIGIYDNYTVKPGDTLASIARAHSPRRTSEGISAYISTLISDNDAQIRYMGIRPGQVNMPLKPGYALYLPPAGKHQKPDSSIQSALLYHNRQDYETRMRIAEITSGAYDLMSIASAGMLIAGIQRLRGINPNTIMNGAAVGVIALSEQFADHVKDRARDLNNEMLKLENQGKAILKLPVSERDAYNEAFKKAHLELNERFNVEIKLLNNIQRTSKKIAFINDPGKMLKLVKYKKSFSVVGSDAYKTLSDVAKYSKFASHSIIALEAINVVGDTIQTYEKGGSWVKELIEGASDVGGSWVGGYAVGTIFMIFGITCWWVIIPSALIAILGGEFADIVSKKLLHDNR